MSEAIIHIDGAARGNPGPAAYAVVIERPGHGPIEEAKALGTATNNVAEYSALIRALELAIELGVRNVRIYSDSELLVKQMNGEYRVKHPDLQSLYQQAMRLRQQVGHLSLEHIRREQNRRADELCNIALDATKQKTKAPKSTKKLIGDATVRAEAVQCLEAALHASPRPPASMVWDQLWSILEDGGVLRKVSKSE